MRGWLTGQDADILVLTETSGGPGTAHLLDRYRQAGWHTNHAANLNGDRGAAILTRLPATIRPEITSDITPTGRAVAVTVDTTPAVTVLGIYVPSSDREQSKIGRKREFIRTLLAVLDRLDDTDRRNLILAGDYNVVSRDHQPPYQGFLPFEYDLLDVEKRLPVDEEILTDTGQLF